MQTADFCSAALHRERFTLRDIDLAREPAVMKVLAEGTGTPIDRVMQTSLLSEEGYVFNFQPGKATTEWILATAASKGEAGKGLSYCPLCLDSAPYYRKYWRFAFNPVCPEHRNILSYGCPTCAKPYNYYHGSANRPISALPITTCKWCGADIRHAPPVQINPGLANHVLKIQDSLNSGIARDSFDVPGYGHVHACAYLSILRSCARSLSSSEDRVRWVLHTFPDNILADMELPRFGAGSPAIVFEHRTLSEIAHLLCLIDTLMRDWPYRFLRFVFENNIAPYVLFPGKENVPYWFERSVEQFLHPQGNSIPPKDGVERTRELLRKRLRQPKTISELNAFMGSVR